MPFIQLNERQFPLRVGAARVGTAPDAEIQLPVGESAPRGTLAIVDVSSDNHASIRRSDVAVVVRVNGVQLGAEPTPLLHGDKIEIAGCELLFGDDRKGGSTEFIAAAALPADIRERFSPAKVAAATGGRLVSLMDGREYAVPAGGLTIGRDASCEVVVPAAEVSRKHAQIRTGENGYEIYDLSANGVLLNGLRIQKATPLGRGDVLRIGNEEFRFYGDAGAPASGAAVATPAAQAPPAGRDVLATLEIVNEGVLKGRHYDLSAPLSHVGRGAHNDVVIPDDSVSDAHAKLQKREQGWFVVDMESTNGTYVGGRRISGEQSLAGASDVRFGGIKLTFRPAAEAREDAKATRQIAGVARDQARRERAPAGDAARAGAAAPVRASSDAPTERRKVPRSAVPAARTGLPGWVWVAALIAVGVVVFFILQGR